MARKRDPEASRAAIEKAAMELFAERGYAATSTSQIAKEAGVAEGTIFRHFKNKKALLVGVMRPLISRFFAPIATRSLKGIFQQRYDSLEAFLEALWDDRIELIQAHPHVIRILLQELSLQPELALLLKDVFAEHVLPAFVVQVDQLREDGLLDRELPVDVVLRHIVSSIASTAILTQVYGLSTGRTLEEEKALVVRLVAHALRVE